MNKKIEDKTLLSSSVLGAFNGLRNSSAHVFRWYCYCGVLARPLWQLLLL